MVDIRITLIYFMFLVFYAFYLCRSMDRIHREFLCKMWELDIKFRADLMKILIKYLETRTEDGNDAK